ncbi:MAG: ABC transporter permease [Ezakiella sp.]|nr:ABC transporter permease [Ezakiella sp.]MDD7472127.1 ABC transporter permease [Bacillota bacterium]MDY3923714.1 ABC transporter permease [Ezakiella sp.]
MSEKQFDINNIPKDKFEFVQIDTKLHDELIQGEAIGFFKDAMIRFRKNKAALVSFIIIAFLAIMAIIGPSLSNYGYAEQNIKLQNMPPRVSWLSGLKLFSGTMTKAVRTENIESKYKNAYIETLSTRTLKGVDMSTIRLDMYKLNEVEDVYYWFGSDSLGRDLWTRLWRGLRISFFISLIAMAVNILVGIIYGAISGYYGGWIDLIMQRIIEIIGGVPYLVIVILFVFYYGPGILPIALAMCLTGWIGMSRMIRAQFLKYKEMEYVLASRTLGASDGTLIFRHILPNAAGIIITMSALEIPGAIFGESFLAYLGLGIQAPEPSIGVLLSEGQKVLLQYPHLTIFPAIVISVMMIAFNLMGNGLRDAFDPTLRGIE